MPMFVDPNAKVAVTIDGANTIHIKAKMDAGTRAAVQDEIRARGLGDGDGELRGIGSYRMTLMVHNIMGWEGPEFLDEKGKPVPCTRANIQRLDPTEPLFEAVGARIGELNEDRKSPDPN